MFAKVMSALDALGQTRATASVAPKVRYAEVIAKETGLRDSFVGFMFGGDHAPGAEHDHSGGPAASVQDGFLGRFGTNLCSTGLIFLADALYRWGPF
jgi:hypothetical protein